jgi:integrase
MRCPCGRMNLAARVLVVSAPAQAGPQGRARRGARGRGGAQRSRLDLGTPPHIVRQIVGHSDIEVTMTIYAHVSLEDKRMALAKLGEALG